ncbi:MAG: SH3 domain-containing protein [Lachnospiraceae bacterium]|nr:SH3 domain-containing protein [Lachnospiraceae bacterium]
MRKKTISNILMGIIVVLCVSICFLIFCIVRRPRYIETADLESAIITENPGDFNLAGTIATNNDVLELPDVDNTPTQEETSAAPMQGKTSTRVNIRNAPSEDGKVLETVDADTTFDIIEVLDVGWTHILYNGEDAYISSAYVIITSE